jgi:hypothetical protein
MSSGVKKMVQVGTVALAATGLAMYYFYNKNSSSKTVQ